MRLTQDLFDARLVEVLKKESEQPLQTWWLSFADTTRPKGEQFIGVIVVDQCRGLVGSRLHLKHLDVPSPSGEIRGFGFDPTMGPADQVAAIARLPRSTLLSKTQLETAGIVIGT